MTILGYTISAPDGGGHYFPEDESGVLCPECRCCIDKSYVPDNLIMSKASYEISCTYDNRFIVSERFKIYCEDNQITCAKFVLVQAKSRLYELTTDRVVQADPVRRKTYFGDRCNVCGQITEIIGADPCYLKNQNAPLGPGFYRTDLEYGNGPELSPSLIVGVETKPLLEAGSFKRIIFEKIVS